MHDQDNRWAAAEARLRAVTETTVDAVITTDANDAILTWNKAAERMFGHGQEIVGRSVTIIIPQRFRSPHRRGIQRYVATGEKHMIDQTVEVAGLRADGSEFPIELSLSTWDYQGRTFFGAIIRDISERKRIEYLQGQVQRIMRHDLKSPLVGITGLARVLLRGDNLDERQRKAASMIQDLGVRMLSFIGRARDLYLMEEGSFHLRPEPLDLLQVLERVVTEIEPLARKEGIGIRLTGPAAAGDELAMMGDEGLLEMMLANLLKNAVEASPPGKTVTLSLRVESDQGRPRLHLDLHNLGEVPQQVRGSFFAAYSSSGKKDGTGLGTHSARLVVLAHQGSIDYTTSVQDGTHLLVDLPMDLPQAGD